MGGVTTRLPSLRRPPIGFAHRGARAHAPENTMEAFALALRLGAPGLETDAWVTADGEAVLDHDGAVGRRPFRRRIAELTSAELPSHIPSVAELVGEIPVDVDVSVDIKDPGAAAPLLEAFGQAGRASLERLWVCHDDHDLLLSWRAAAPGVRLVDSTRTKAMPHGPERHAARLRELDIDAVNLHHSEWKGGLTVLYHRFERLTFGWDCQFDRVLDELLDMGIDGVYSDHTDRMVDALGRVA